MFLLWGVKCNTWWHYCNSTRKVWHKYTRFCTFYQTYIISIFCPEQVLCILGNTSIDCMVWISLFPVINEHLEHFNNLHSKLYHLCHANSVDVDTDRYWIEQQLLHPRLTVEMFQVLQAFARAEKKLKPNWKEMFTEVLSTRWAY